MPKFIATLNGQKYEIEAPDEQAAAQAIANMQPGSGSAVYGPAAGQYAGRPITKGQERNLSAIGTNDVAPIASSMAPRFETPDSGPGATGVTFMRDGSVVDVGARDPISKKFEAAGSGLLSAALFGSKNEIGAGLGAMPELLTGGYGAAKDDFLSTLERFDAQDATLRENHPYAYYGGGAAGLVGTAAATPVVRTGRAALDIAGNATIGSAIGGYGGFMGTDGSIADRVKAAAVGAGLGGVAGAVGGRVGDPANIPAAPRLPMPGPYQAIPDVNLQRGLGYVRRQMGSMAPDDLYAPANPNMTAAEVIGPRGRTALGALARMEGETAPALEGQLSSRAMARPQRLMSAFEQASGITPEAAAGDIEAIVAQGRQRAAPLYDKAYAQPFAPQSDTIDRLMSRPSMQSALSRAYRIAAEEGRNPKTLGFELGPNAETVRIQSPTIQTLDYVKRGLDDVLEHYRDPVTKRLNLNTEGRAIAATANEFRNEIKRLSPAYADAVNAAGDYERVRSAFDEGTRYLFNNRMTARQFQERVARMGDAERSAHASGAANSIFNLAQTGRLKPSILKTPIIRDKLEAVLGKDGADAITNAVSDEETMLAFERRYAPGAGSITSEIAQAQQDMANPLLDSAINAGTAAVRGGSISHGIESIVRDAANHVADRFRNVGMDTPARDVAGQALRGSPQELAAALRSLPPPRRPVLRAGQAALHAGLTKAGGRLSGLASNRMQ